MHKLPTIYKKTKTGAIQTWTVSVDILGPNPAIVTRFGQLGGAIQVAEDIITEGKNIGKANETTPLEQAIKEANSLHINKLDREGYTLDESGVKETGIPVPMLAHKYTDHGHKLKLPLYTQPKMDGIRCLAVKRDGKVALYSRKGKEFTGLPHINAALEKLPGDFVLDGEFYNHKWKDDFNHIVHLVKQVKPCTGHEEVEFHVFDIIGPGTFTSRITELRMKNLQSPLVTVETNMIYDTIEVEAFYDAFANENYEGVMLRDPQSSYEHSRSYGLQKYKKFEDAEFKIVKVEEGRGKRAGRLGSFVCVTDQGVEFNCDLNATHEEIKEIWDNRDSYIGKELTVRFQGYFKDTLKPRFPKGVAIRSYE